MDKNLVQNMFFGYGCVIGAIKKWNSFHRHDEIQFGFYEKGPVEYQLGGQVYRIRQNECVLFWSAIPHLLVTSPPDNIRYWVTIPLNIFIGWGLPEAFTHEILNGKMLKSDHTKLRDLDILSLRTWKEDFCNGDENYRDIISLGIESRIRRFGIESKVDKEINSSIKFENRSLFVKVYEYISKKFHDDISIADIAENAGVHPNYLMTVFKKSCGQSIGQYIAMLRIYEAQRLLTTTDMKIIDIAMESGFGSLSNFYNCFNKYCGKSPKKYRING
ncbi:AraC family transcriptional regulator [Desulfoluna spongiiphila]|uniref:Transcriptional regulator, AraC family n=1 Tax=Desulfoluna spongiiphila TaxID=419481 RepID=A0A1G5CPY7_9BACT|nr:AraC family transcriptional regulator [Desulfoluna spongiiphila]SCY04513.1 transcriptional regulator, AraC family [Desulfoluna spongiiphila]